MQMNNINKLIGNRIANIRINVAGLTQKDFAEKIGVAQQHTISGWETGKIKPGMLACLKIVNIAKQYGKDITINWLRPDLDVDDVG